MRLLTTLWGPALHATLRTHALHETALWWAALHATLRRTHVVHETALPWWAALHATLGTHIAAGHGAVRGSFPALHGSARPAALWSHAAVLGLAAVHGLVLHVILGT
ncbi:MAG: hypothetical protein HYU36_02455, partial [Planctomycetes bacterium]|nr:hypothetical protein [Planctomycetota bacterium]